MTFCWILGGRRSQIRSSPNPRVSCVSFGFTAYPFLAVFWRVTPFESQLLFPDDNFGDFQQCFDTNDGTGGDPETVLGFFPGHPFRNVAERAVSQLDDVVQLCVLAVGSVAGNLSSREWVQRVMDPDFPLVMSSM